MQASVQSLLGGVRPSPVPQSPVPDNGGQQRRLPQRANGKSAPFRRCRYVMVPGADMNADHQVLVDLDYMTERLGELQEKLREVLHVREQMVQNVSHELRSPLTLILGYAESLQYEFWGPLNPDQQKAVDVIQRHAQKLHAMIERLLMLQSLNGLAVECMPVALDALVNLTVQRWQPRVQALNGHLHVEIEPNLPRVMGNANLLIQVLDELLDNALKFSLCAQHRAAIERLEDRGTTEAELPDIEIRVWSEGEWVRLAVRDHGIGLPPAERERIFDSFYQVDGGLSRLRGGMGVGLTLCRRIVQLHGGRIQVASPGPNQGSTFTVSLPIMRSGREVHASLTLNL